MIKAVYIVLSVLCAFAFYLMVWLLAYPAIGGYCKTSAIVKTSTLTGRDWSGDIYRTTFTDGTQASTEYVKIGQTVCLKAGARFPW